MVLLRTRLWHSISVCTHSFTLSQLHAGLIKCLRDWTGANIPVWNVNIIACILPWIIKNLSILHLQYIQYITMCKDWVLLAWDWLGIFLHSLTHGLGNTSGDQNKMFTCTHELEYISLPLTLTPMWKKCIDVGKKMMTSHEGFISACECTWLNSLEKLHTF